MESPKCYLGESALELADVRAEIWSWTSHDFVDMTYTNIEVIVENISSMSWVAAKKMLFLDFPGFKSQTPPSTGQSKLWPSWNPVTSQKTFILPMPQTLNDMTSSSENPSPKLITTSM